MSLECVELVLGFFLNVGGHGVARDPAQFGEEFFGGVEDGKPVVEGEVECISIGNEDLLYASRIARCR